MIRNLTLKQVRYYCEGYKLDIRSGRADITRAIGYRGDEQIVGDTDSTSLQPNTSEDPGDA